FFVIQPHHQVTARVQIVLGFHGIPGHQVVVVHHAVCFSHTPQFTTAIVMVDLNGLPGVFIKIEHTLGVYMALAIFQGGFYFPHTVQFVAGQILINVAGFYDVIVLNSRIFQLVRVVRNVHFLLADQFPVVTVRTTVVHIQVGRGTHTLGGSTRTVVSHLRSQAYTTLTSVIYPGLTRFFYLIQRFVYQQYVTRQASRRQHVLLEGEQYVFVFVRREVGQLGTEGKLILQTH